MHSCIPAELKLSLFRVTYHARHDIMDSTEWPKHQFPLMVLVLGLLMCNVPATQLMEIPSLFLLV